MNTSRKQGLEHSRYRDREKPAPPWLKWIAEAASKYLKLFFLSIIIISMIKFDISSRTCKNQSFSADLKKHQKVCCENGAQNLIQSLIPLAQASSSFQDEEQIQENQEEIQREMKDSFVEHEERSKIRRLRKRKIQNQVQYSWKPSADLYDSTGSQVQSSVNLRILQSGKPPAPPPPNPPAPDPVLNTNLVVSQARSTDCNTYTFTWSYTGINGSPNADFDILTSGSNNNWNSLVVAGTSPHSPLFSNLKSYGYFFGSPITFRLRFNSNSYSYSTYYTGTTASDLLKQVPQIVTGLSVTQTLTSIQFSWTALSSSWTNSNSPIGTGNDPVAYQMQKCTVSGSNCNFANYASSVSHPTVTISFTLPDTSNFNWNSNQKFKILATNICGTSSSVEFAYSVQSFPPVALSMPIKTTAYENTIKISWTALTTDAEQGYREVTSYELSYCLSTSCPNPSVTTSPYTALTETSLLYYQQTVRAGIINWAFGSTYYFRVRARNAAGLGSYSSPLTVLMPSIAVVAPVLSLTSKSMTSIVIQWTSITSSADLGNNPLLYYQLQWSSSSTFSTVTNTLTGTGFTSTSFTLERSTYPYSSATQYYFRVAIYNQAGLGPYSTIFSVMTPTNPVKMATPTAPTVTPLQIVIQWTRLISDSDIGYDPIQSYTLQRCSGSTTCTNFVTIATLGPSEGSNTEVYSTSNTPRGVITRYQIYATNSIGQSTPSDPLTFTTDNIPQSMTTVTCAFSYPHAMVLTWPAVDPSLNGGDPITFYAVEYSVSSSNYAQLNTDYSNLYLTYTYSNGDTLFPANTDYSFKVRAKNGIDYSSVYSSVVTCTTPTYPSGMNTPTHGAVNPSSIVINWANLTDASLNGRTAINYYKLEWYNTEISPATWQEITAEANGLLYTYTHTRTGSIFPSGSTQSYRILPKNIYGWGSTYSSTLNVQADQVPIRMNNPTSLTIYPGSIATQWSSISADSDTGRDPVIFYHIYWDKGKGTAANDWLTLTDYPISTTMITSFNHTLTTGTIFSNASTQTYKVCAQNGVGEGACGTLSVLADQTPIRMNNPTSVSIYPGSIAFQWVEISLDTDTGRDAVNFYHVYWDQGKGALANDWLTLTNYPISTTIITSYNHTLTAGTIFSSASIQTYKVCAQNGVGEGACGTLSVTADQTPKRMNTPTQVTVYPGSIAFQWVEISLDTDTGRDAVNFYHVYWDQGKGDAPNNWITLTNYPTSKAMITSFNHTLTAGTIFSSASTQTYKVCAQNGVGEGACGTLSVTADQTPIRMNTPTSVTIYPGSIAIQWEAITLDADTGRDEINFYHVYWDQGKGIAANDWLTLTNYPTSKVMINSYNHTLAAGTTFTNASTQVYKVCAQNGVGEGACGTLSVTADQTPIRMNTPTLVSVNPDSIQIQWTPITLDADTGRDSINFYHVQWDQGKGIAVNDWLTVTDYPTSSTLITSFTHTLTTGTVFKSGSYQNYQICAQNGVGLGACSSPLQITADSIPQVIDPVIPVANIYPQKVVVTWTETDVADNGGDTITDYLLQWNQGTGVWVDIDTKLNGMTTTYNHIPPSILTSGGTYKYRLYSKNGVGYSLPSNEIEITADKVPQACNAPVIKEDDDVQEQQIVITWTEINILDNGGDPVIFYLLEWDSGTTAAGSTITWTALNSQDSNLGVKTQYTHMPTSKFTPGGIIRYRLTAKNGVGYGAISNETPVRCDDVPIKMSVPKVSMIRSNSIDLYWDLLTAYEDTGRNPIKYYRIEFFERACYATPYSLLSSCTTGFNDLDGTDGTWVDITSTVTTVQSSFKHTTITFFSEGKNFNYRIRAFNGVGFGPYSDVISVKTPTRPTFMNEPTCDYIKPKEISISWVPLSNSTQFSLQGNEIITYYTLEVDTGTGYSVLNLTGLLVTNKVHYSTTPFTKNTIFKYRVAASNSVGMGAYSSELSITTDNIPNAVPNFVNTTVSPRQIKLSWSALTLDSVTGRDEVTYYKLEYHDNKATTTLWTELTASTSAAVTTFTHDVVSPFPANLDQSDYTVKYRISATNGVGYGPITELGVVTKTYPRKMDKITLIEPDPDFVTINWLQLTTSDQDTGGDPVYHYQLQWIKQTDTSNSWTSLTSYNFTGNTKTTNTFSDNTWYRVRISAVNGVGIGDYSDEELIQTDDYPNRLQRMPAPTEDSQTNATMIKINWILMTDILDTGRDPINQYKIYWDEGKGGNNNWKRVSTSFVHTYTWNLPTYTIKNGTTYQFKVLPGNNVGDGEVSPILLVIPSSPPDRMSSPVITLDQSDTMVKVAWTYPRDNGDSVKAYMVEFRATDNTWYTLNDTCDGSIPNIVTGKYCYVHMQKLREAPFLLLKNDKIVVRINAMNIKGYNNSASIVTDSLFTVVIETEPDAPGTPIRGANTDYNVLHTSWSGISNLALAAGGITSSITSYEIQRNIGNTTAPDPDSDTWISLQGFTSNNTNLWVQTSMNIQGGTTYQLRVRAYNKYGWGSWSQIYSIICARAPDAPQWITIDNSTINFLLKWQEPFNRGLSITRYYIAVQKKGTDANVASNYYVNDDCQGDDLIINSTQTCTIKMVTLRSTAYLYSLNDKIRVRIWAENPMGQGSATIWQTTSTGNNAQIQTQPSAPSTSVVNYPLVTTDLQIKITWAELPSVDSWGGIQIDTYEVWWYDPNTFSDYEILYSDNQPFQLGYIHTRTATNDPPGITARAIIPGALYKMKYRAINIHGEGSFSPETSIYASTIPDKLDPPVTTLTNVTVWIQWNATPNDHSQAVTKYAIRFKTSTGSFIEDSGCSGASPAIVSAMKCSMAMTKFTSSPFNLNIDTLIEVTLDAYNVMGWSGQSLPNTVGVPAMKPPQVAPTSLARGINTGKNTMHLTWIGLSTNAQTGGQNVDYKIQYDKSTGSWTQLVASTNNATSYQELNTVNFKTGNYYQFKVQAFNDFGAGSFSANFGIWAAIPPSGLAAPSTTLNFNSYVEEDDIVVVDWDPPTDNGGLWVSYGVDIMAKSGVWVSVSVGTECYENNTAIIDYKMPLIPVADLGTRCTLLVTNLKSKYQLVVGDIVKARVTASHVVGSVTSAEGGMAILPVVPCFRTTFPRIIGGSNSNSNIRAMDVDDNGHIVVGGETQDSNLLEGKIVSNTLPMATYIAKGNYYQWAKYFQTTDTINTAHYQQVSDITFRWDGEKIAIALDKINYDISYTIVVLNKDGTLYGAYREGQTNARAKVFPGGMIFDSSNMITVALDFATDGTITKRLAVINRFPVTQQTAGTFNTQFYLIGGGNANNIISQGFSLQRIRGDTTQFYFSALITEASGTRRGIIGKSAFSNGALQKNVAYTPGSDYNSDTNIGVVKRMNLDENDLLQQHIISACIMSQDNYRIHFGEFLFVGNSLPSATVLTPNQLSTYNTYNCLGTFSRNIGTLYFLYNYRQNANSALHQLVLGRVTTSSKKLDQLQISSHNGPNTYGGGKFIHMSRFYYFGTSNKIYNGNTLTNQPMFQAWINIFDPLEWIFHCNPTSQSFSIPNSGSINLNQVLLAQMDWKQTALTTTTGFANSVTKQMKSLGTISGLFNLNLGESLSNNTWCPIVTTDGAPTVTVPVIENQMFTFNPDVSGAQTQSFQFNSITISRFCPDNVIYNLTYISKTSSPLPSFITLKGENNSYIFDVSTTSHVGTYPIALRATLGNNKTAITEFTCQVASPCLNNPVSIPTYSIPIYDISEWAPKYIDLNWEVTNSTPSCGSLYQIFTIVNSTTGGPIDPNIYSIVNQTSGIQRIKISTSYIPYTKLWTDLQINSYLQGDFVASKIFTINITNDCAPTIISAQSMPDWIYYTGRDSIDLKFVWTETVGKCGPISYTLRDYQLSDSSSNNTLDSTIFTYPSVVGTNNTLKVFTQDESKVGTYRIRVYASLGVGGYKQSSTWFTFTIIRDPCAYYTFTVPFIDDLTLWINQTSQTVSIPFFQMSDPSWICNFTYVITSGSNTAIDPIFVKNEVVPQATNPSVSLVTTDKTKVELSPYTIKVKGWPTRQPSSVSLALQFRVFIAYFDKTDCPPGKYFNLVTENCNSCTSPCSQCIENPTKCTWCIDTHTYVETFNSCILKTDPCPTGVKDPFLPICRKCTEFCKTCTDYLTCTMCIPNYSLANNKCYPPRYCPEGFTYNGLGCTQCPMNCASCVSSTVCNYCMTGSYLNTLTNQCVTICPAGYYGDEQSRVCMLCSPACKTCVSNNYTCTSCQDITINGVTTYKYLFGNTCVDRCPYLQYFQNHANRSCTPCNPACMICVSAFDDCIVCNKGSVISGRSCLNSCPAKSYITVIGTCFPCDPACQICTGAMNSMCSECVAGQFLTQTTCEPRCNPPLFPDIPTKTCKECPYYCNQCTMATDCQKCKAGFRQVPNNCEGEMFMRTNGQYQINVPLDSTLMSVNPRQMTSEIWFKIDNPLSLFTEVILGTAPYKLRKKANLAQVQLNFDRSIDQLNYCDSFNLKADTWYHFAYSIDEEKGTLFCYLNGEKLSTGLASVSIISADILGFREITFGGSIELKTSESKFVGYVKEFRWWKIARTQFQIQNFKDIAFIIAPSTMYAYWRLDEDRKTQTALKESVKNAQYTPAAPLILSQIIEMREIFLKICPEGYFQQFNETSFMAECVKCDESCKNCNGVTNTSCTECVSPYKLIEAEQKCIIVEGCPVGYYEDIDLQCKPCHEYCITCVNTPTQCPKCKAKYFKQYKGLGCVDSCPRGLYGNYITQACSANPIVTSLFPEDGSIFSYGEFIDLYATFDVLNLEQKETYQYGWIISKLNSNVDLAKDAAKPYFGTDITRVHLDNNIIEPNNYYNITFFVKGLNAFYNGMLGSMFNVIYIGIPPKNGKCFISPGQGIATVTQFRISTSGWVDIDGIAEYSFYYSYDNGETFIPIKTENSRIPGVTIVFEPIFNTIAGQIRCSAKSIKGFMASSDTQFVLVKKQSTNAKVELAKLNVSKVTDEKDAVIVSTQIYSIAKELGKLIDIDKKAFDAKVTPDQCTKALCNYQGQCVHDQFTKKYFCKCNKGYAGVNCTFNNQTDLDMLRNKTLSLARLYNPLSLSGRRTYDFQFLNSITKSVDLMTEDIHDAIFDIVAYQVNKIRNSDYKVGDNSDVLQNMNIISNMLEYQYLQSFTFNQTGQWKVMQDAEIKKDKIFSDLNKTVELINILRNNTLKRLSFLQTEVAIQTRMISYRQILQSKDSILAMPATTGIKKQQQTFVKISPTNFINSTVNLNDQFIAETVEYAFNPFQLNNTDNVASNILEVNLFNYNRTSDGGSKVNYVNISNLIVPIEFSFPVSDNHNLTEFLTSYNQLNNFKYSDVQKKDMMIKKSNLSCVFWDKVENAWSKQGCQLQSLDKNHIKCNCTHLSSFAILFNTPKLSVDAPLMENTTIAASSELRRNVTLKDIIKWPLDAYFANMYKLWQHNRPSFISFIIKPGFAVLILFWAMYFSSLIYYSGQDDLKRFKMTKQQNRDDLAELKDDSIQNVMPVIKELIVKDFIQENTKFIQRETRRMKLQDSTGLKKAVKPPQIMIYETMSKEDQKKYKKRARRKVFGRPGGLCDRAKRVYDITMKHNTKNPNAKMSFFNEELKNNLWIGLVAKTSKIAPRHVRLVLMYFYSSLYITLLTLIFAFGLQEYISDQALFQVCVLAISLIILVWIVTIPVALIFRMPLHLRNLVAGVRTKKVNKAFQVVDQHMGWRYAVGYFICLTMFFVMTVVVLVFNIFYPHDYVMGWFFNIILIYILDMLVFTFALAAFQMVCVIASGKIKCFYSIWKALEVFRYVKNLRG